MSWSIIGVVLRLIIREDLVEPDAVVSWTVIPMTSLEALICVLFVLIDC